MANSEYGRGTRSVTASGSLKKRRAAASKTTERSTVSANTKKPVRRTSGKSVPAAPPSRADKSKTAARTGRTQVKKGSSERSSAEGKSRAKVRKPLREQNGKIGELDYTLLFLIILIVALGLIVMLSASAPTGKSIHNNSYYFFKRQLLFIVMGFVGMYVISRIDLERYRYLIPHAFWACVLLLILVLIPGIGVKVNGARRWLNIPFIQFQPSELMKPVIAMYIADLIRRGHIDLHKLKDNFKCMVYIGIVAFLLMCETHLSGTIVIVGIAICVMLAGGTPVKSIIVAGAALGLMVFVYLQFDPTRMERVKSLIDPFADAQDSGYQISQSIYAIGSGRLFGLGLGQSVQKYSHLPEPYNDFIFAIVCEELGFVGGVVVILLFAALFLRAMTVAVKAPDTWSTLTCIGIASQLGIQAVLNMGVAVSIIPNTGVSLPFFSYGGTSILILLLEMGILLNISRKSIKN
ncbi:MAG: putative lipid II flippase FtsW [Clostridiales bacterium]|nr:putative lipid II flippase FtsW [Clostridiales bacterium]